jgi:hypothetical protein
LAFALDLASAGNNKPAKMAMIAMTTRSSIKVNPRGGLIKKPLHITFPLSGFIFDVHLKIKSATAEMPL